MVLEVIVKYLVEGYLVLHRPSTLQASSCRGNRCVCGRASDLKGKIQSSVQWLDHSTLETISGFLGKDFNRFNNLPWDVQEIFLLLVVKL